jgi:hypothetical protein
MAHTLPLAEERSLIVEHASDPNFIKDKPKPERSSCSTIFTGIMGLDRFKKLISYKLEIGRMQFLLPHLTSGTCNLIIQ